MWPCWLTSALQKEAVEESEALGERMVIRRDLARKKKISDGSPSPCGMSPKI